MSGLYLIGKYSLVYSNQVSSLNLLRLGHNPAYHTPAESLAIERLSEAFEHSQLDVAHRLAAFPRHVRRQDISRFLCRYEIFKLALPTHGSVVDCGVFGGAGLMAWYHFSSILEPYNHTRRVFGFDTFLGFASLHDKDLHGVSEHHHSGAFDTASPVQRELEELIEIHDSNRPIGHIPKVTLIAGDARETIPKFLEDQPHVLVSLLYLDFDLYEPTKTALEHFLPRVVKGGIVAFDELNCEHFVGETTALLETMGAPAAELKRTNLDPYISYFIR